MDPISSAAAIFTPSFGKFLLVSLIFLYTLLIVVVLALMQADALVGSTPLTIEIAGWGRVTFILFQVILYEVRADIAS